MTIQELYEWEKENNVLDCDIVVKDFSGCDTHLIEPEIIKYNGFCEVEL